MTTPEKQCDHCKIWKPLTDFHLNCCRKDGRHNQCKKCRANYGKTYRQTEMCRKVQTKAHIKERAKFPGKIKARQKLKNAIRAGKITRPDTCESCKEKKFVEGHHEDYSKPLEVDWLCIECHTELHRKEI